MTDLLNSNFNQRSSLQKLIQTSKKDLFPSDRPQLDLNLLALQQNIEHIRSITQDKTMLCAVVKADAYGIGIELLAPLYSAFGIECFLVSSIWEALELRKIGICEPIFALDCPSELASQAAESRIDVILHSTYQVNDFLRHLKPKSPILRTHINFNTGMSRLDCQFDEAYNLAQKIQREPRLILSGIMSHLNCADNCEDDAYTQQQMRGFETLNLALQQSGINPPYKHILNSAGILRFPQGISNLVRSGIGLLGASSANAHVQAARQLKSVLSLHAPIRQILSIEPKQALGYNNIPAPEYVKKVAIVQYGYADGLARIPPPQAAVWIRGKLCKLLAHTCMDFCFVDVTHIADLHVGERAYIFDANMTHANIMAASKLWNKRSYEWLVTLSKRTKRNFLMKGIDKTLAKNISLKTASISTYTLSKPRL